MSLLLEIPDQAPQGMRLPLKDQKQQVMTELAVALYARGISKNSSEIKIVKASEKFRPMRIYHVDSNWPRGRVQRLEKRARPI